MRAAARRRSGGGVGFAAVDTEETGGFEVGSEVGGLEIGNTEESTRVGRMGLKERSLETLSTLFQHHFENWLNDFFWSTAFDSELRGPRIGFQHGVAPYVRRTFPAQPSPRLALIRPRSTSNGSERR